MKIILISKPKIDEDEIPIVVKLFESGLELFHLRKPKASSKQMKGIIEKFPAHFHKRIVIHSHHQLARKFDLGGVHYTRTHLRKNFKNWWRKVTLRLSKSHIIRSSSTTKLSGLYDTYDIEFNYMFLSPVFDSLTGKFQSGFYEDGLKAAIKKSGKNIIARGGIDIRRLEKIKELNFHGFALSSCIWDSKDPLKEYLDIIAKCRDLKMIS